jgi:UDP-N-acetylmuramoyl-tripeptide--D-alanyl-D-alanine ligase
VIDWDAARLAEVARAQLLSAGDAVGGPGGLGATRGAAGPTRAMVDSRQVQPGDLFVGLAGEREDGGAYAAQALAAGAWGVLVAPTHAESLASAEHGVVLAHPDPLAGLQALASAWRLALGARVVAITGSTGKTSTKDILAALLSSHMRTVASPQNLNTEIGLPLAILAAPPGTEALVLELAMRGSGQIAELTAIAQPDVGVIVNVGPVHLELLGSIEAVAAAKA